MSRLLCPAGQPATVTLPAGHTADTDVGAATYTAYKQYAQTARWLHFVVGQTAGYTCLRIRTLQWLRYCTRWLTLAFVGLTTCVSGCCCGAVPQLNKRAMYSDTLSIEEHYNSRFARHMVQGNSWFAFVCSTAQTAGPCVNKYPQPHTQHAHTNTGNAGANCAHPQRSVN